MRHARGLQLLCELVELGQVSLRTVCDFGKPLKSWRESLVNAADAVTQYRFKTFPSMTLRRIAIWTHASIILQHYSTLTHKSDCRAMFMRPRRPLCQKSVHMLPKVGKDMSDLDQRWPRFGQDRRNVGQTLARVWQPKHGKYSHVVVGEVPGQIRIRVRSAFPEGSAWKVLQKSPGPRCPMNVRVSSGGVQNPAWRSDV